MFTVKLIQNHDAPDEEELLYQAGGVEYRKNARREGMDNGPCIRLIDVNGTGGHLDIYGPKAMAFVMNEQGATVSRYDI